MQIQIQFRYKRVYQFLTSVHGGKRRDTILTMLTPPQRAAYLVMFKFSIGRDPKNPTTSINGQNPTLCLNGLISTASFQNSQILRTISSGHDVIYTPAPTQNNLYRIYRKIYIGSTECYNNHRCLMKNMRCETTKMNRLVGWLFSCLLVLWHINPCGVINAKCTLYIYIRYI